MPYVALYRKWRPVDFDQLVGQDHISKTLKSAITTGRIAHAYLFSGPRGTGKTSTAKILAKALNCETGPTPVPCNRCACCIKINTGSSMDVFEIDAASNRGIDEIRDLRETVKFAPVDGRYKVYIIDEVHMLTTEAFNALLKTLEEPPSHVVFILATTEAHKVPATIHSRCQRYDFRRIGMREIAKHLSQIAEKMQLKAEPEALTLIASHADGGLRDALSILDQCSAAKDEAVTAENVRRLLGLVGHEFIWKLTEALAKRETRQILHFLDQLISAGKEAGQILSETALHLRSVMLFQAAHDLEGMDVFSSDLEVLKRHSELLTYGEICRAIQTMHAAMNEVKWSPQPRIALEIAFLSFCHQPSPVPAAAQEKLLKRLEVLERRIETLSSLSEKASKPTDAFSGPVSVGTAQQPPSRAVALRPQAVLPAKVPQRPEADAVDIGAKQPVQTAQHGAVSDVWARVLKSLTAKGKAAVYACVAQGNLQSFDGTRAVIAFTAKFPKERTDKPDYREILSSVFSEICANKVEVQCALVTAATAPVPAQPEKKRFEERESLTEAQRHALDTAIEVFGDDIHKET